MLGTAIANCACSLPSDHNTAVVHRAFELYVVRNTCFALPIAGHSSRSRLQGTQGARAYTQSRRGFQPGSVALGPSKAVQSGKKSWGGVPSSQSEAGRWKTYIIHFLLLLAAAVSCLTTLPPMLSTMWQPRTNSSRTSSSPSCDGHRRCNCARGRVCRVSCRPSK